MRITRHGCWEPNLNFLQEKEAPVSLWPPFLFLEKQQGEGKAEGKHTVLSCCVSACKMTGWTMWWGWLPAQISPRFSTCLEGLRPLVFQYCNGFFSYLETMYDILKDMK